jgi:Ca2+-binding RTX toxin-like protein
VGRVVGVMVVLLLLLGSLPSQAAAGLELTERADQSPATTFRELRGTNLAPEPNAITIAQDGTSLAVTDLAGIDTVPDGCSRSSTTRVLCPLIDYDELAFFTGPANDSVDVQLFSYPDLTIDQIVGPRVAVFVNATLGAGNDIFRGGNGTDAVGAGRGRDRLFGGGANDLLDAGPGNDFISGGPGTDEMFGHAGRDRLIAGAGVPDYMIAGKGRDTCVPHDGRDRVASCEKVRF